MKFVYIVTCITFLNYFSKVVIKFNKLKIIEKDIFT